ncbi:MAG: hypothetical protein JXR94_21830 [Candidatus Hydrogenedentes bacterium]|nr:hypothetical protein [Candidatus Hydrogenedentota bacterium]
MLAGMMLVLAAAFPPDAVVVEAEAFDVAAHWMVGACRADCAPGGLSGGAALNANQPGARATTGVDLPEGSWTVWVRVFDWAGAPGHYQSRLTINGRAQALAVSEPVLNSYIWEKWGTVDGGALALELSHPDSFNSAVDCILFAPDPAFEPASGPAIDLVHAQLSRAFPDGPGTLHVRLRPGHDVAGVTRVALMLAREGAARDVVWRDEVPLPAGLHRWPAGQDIDLPAIALPACPFLWPGSYVLRVGVPNSQWILGQPVARFEKEETSMPAPCRAELRPYRGAPTIHVNGTPEFPFAYLIHAGDMDKHYAQMAAIGVRFFTLAAGLGASPDGFDPAGCDGPFLRVLRHQPDALLFPRVGVTAPDWWCAQYPDECVVFDDGTTGPQSMFSERWLADACQWVEDHARYIRSSPYAGHVIGIHLCSGVSAEWQSWGLWSNRRGDFSAPAQRAWRAYLGAKYRDDAALAAAWHRPGATLDTAAMPSRARREAEGPFLRSPGEFQDVIDFYDFYWRGTAKAIQALAAAAKRGGGRDWLVGFFYGYAIQYGGKMQESQHLGMRDVMDCPDIDFFCSPCMYSLRAPGGTSTFMSFTDSIRMRGKLWWDEADNRTHLAKDRAVAPAADLFESLNVLEREFAHAFTRRAAIWWFDMQGGWYDDPAILELFRQFRVFGEAGPRDWNPPAEIAVFVDDKSSYRLRPEEPFLHDGITAFLAELPRLGAPYHTYLLGDVAAVSGYKLCIFPLAFDLSDAERAAIEALKGDGRTLLFVGPAGIGRVEGGRVHPDPALSAALLGTGPEGSGWKHIDHGAWRLAWTPEPHPALADVRDIARAAGVHLYHEQDDALYAGNGLIALHAQSAGPKTLRFPAPVALRELFTDAPLEHTGTALSFDLQRNETRCFAVTGE